MSTVLP